MFVHPSTRGFAGPDEHYLWNTVGNPVETTVTAAHMVMSGVMERHPDLKVLLAHGGGAVLALRGRLRHAHEHLAAAPSVDGRGLAAALLLRHDHARPGRAARARRVRRAPSACWPAPTTRSTWPTPTRAATVRASGVEPDRGGGDPRRQRGGAAGMNAAEIVVAGAGPQQPDHRRVPGARRLRGARARLARDPGRRRRLGGAARAGLRDRLVLDRPHADPDQPAAARRRARAARPLRARVPRARPVRARRVPGRART